MLPQAREEISEFSVYKHGKTVAELKDELGVSEIIKLGSNENMLGISPKAVEAIKAHAEECYFYPEPASTILARKIAERYGFDANRVVVGAGTTDIIEMVALAYFEDDDKVIVPHPSFIMYPIATALMDAEMVRTPLKNWVVDVDAIIDAIDSDTKAIFLANPNNPTGTIITTSEMDRLITKVPENVLLVLDEAYSDLVESDDYPDSMTIIQERKNVITLRSMSKSYGLAGMRVGFAVGSEEVVANLTRVKKPFNVTRLAQEAAIAALDDLEFIKKTREYLAKGRNYLYKEFKRLNIFYVPTETNFILTVMDSDEKAKRCYDYLMNRGIITRYMGNWGVSGGLRITIGLKWQNERVIKAMEEFLSRS